MVVTQRTPRKSAELFERIDRMTPSKSSLGRLPKVLAERWENHREAFEAALRDGLQIPEGAVSIAVSLDGVLAPIDGANNATEDSGRGMGEQVPGRLPRSELRDGVVLRREGQFLGAVRMARAPETKKATLTKMLTAETSAILSRRPDLKLVKVADGAADNWAYLSSDALPSGEEAVDFFHASEHLHVSIATVYGDNTHETQFFAPAASCATKTVASTRSSACSSTLRASIRARHPSRPSSLTSASTGSACATWCSSRRDS